MRRHPDEKIIYALFDQPKQVELAYQRLIRAQIDIDDISLLMNEDVHDRDFKMLDRNKTKEGATAGSVLGGTIGGILGGLVSLGSAASGIGLVIVGPALALAAAGGLIGGLVGHGIPKDEAQHLHEELRAGKAMIAVHLHDPKKLATAKEILGALKAETVGAPAGQ